MDGLVSCWCPGCVSSQNHVDGLEDCSVIFELSFALVHCEPKRFFFLLIFA